MSKKDNMNNELKSTCLNKEYDYLLNESSDTFIFRYDPESNVDRLFADFWDAVDGKTKSTEPHIVCSSSIDALATNLNKSRLEIFTAIVEKQPSSISELAQLLQKDYALVWRNIRILEGMGLIKLVRKPRVKLNDEVKPIALYKRIIFDFPAREKSLPKGIVAEQAQA